MSPEMPSASGEAPADITGAESNTPEQIKNTPAIAAGQGPGANSRQHEDLAPYRVQLRRFLALKGIEILPGDVLRCPQGQNHANGDAHPSAKLYENPGGDQIFCAVCAASWGIFEV